MIKRIPIVIPSYEPNEELLQLCERLSKSQLNDIIIVDDGSGMEYRSIFDRVEETYQCVVLRHETNQGKGRALKTAFSFLLEQKNEILGCVTADSDGQHSPEDISKCIEALKKEPEHLILGCRDFDGDNVPRRSRMGNKITRKVCKFLCAIEVSDSQTGLRAIPADFMAHLLQVQGERFEFEMNMLIEAANRCSITEIPIETIYESVTDHKSHFRTFSDSWRIYRIFGKIFLKFALSSLSSSIIDVVLFSLLCTALEPVSGKYYVTYASVLARCVSVVYNYLMNHRVVFKSEKGYASSALKYFSLAAIQMILSTVLVTGGVWVLQFIPAVIIKIIVDTILFLFSYYIQRRFIF